MRRPEVARRPDRVCCPARGYRPGSGSSARTLVMTDPLWPGAGTPPGRRDDPVRRDVDELGVQPRDQDRLAAGGEERGELRRLLVVPDHELLAVPGPRPAAPGAAEPADPCLLRGHPARVARAPGDHDVHRPSCPYGRVCARAPTVPAKDLQAVQGWRGRAVDSQDGQGSVMTKEKQVFCRPACSVRPLSGCPFWRSDGQVHC